MEESAKRFLRNPTLSDVESLASGPSAATDIPFMLQILSGRVPELLEDYLLVSVCHVEEPNHFWFHRIDNQSKRNYRYRREIID